MHIAYRWKSQEVADQEEDPGVGRWTILGWKLEGQKDKERPGITWIRIGSNGGGGEPSDRPDETLVSVGGSTQLLAQLHEVT
jgi:hypothetical protein